MGRNGIGALAFGLILGLFATSVFGCVEPGTGGGGGGTIPTKSANFVAIVGETKVEMSDLDREYQFRGYFKEYIFQVMLRDKAKREGFTITEEDLDKQIEDVISKSGGVEGLAQFLEAYQITEQDFRESQKTSIITRWLLEQRIPISEEDVRDFYDSNVSWVKQAHGSNRGFTQAELEMLTYDDVKETAQEMIFQERAGLEYGNLRKDIILEYKDGVVLHPQFREIDWSQWIGGEEGAPEQDVVEDGESSEPEPEGESAEEVDTAPDATGGDDSDEVDTETGADESSDEPEDDAPGVESQPEQP